ncbi:hypothetical protein BGZ54_006557 [Gamsiella multidivaricata]|nr:hypothetical protein BGZ54_006557 [Gamsiella multidivaricata]
MSHPSSTIAAGRAGSFHIPAIPFVTPLGIEPQDVPWLADLIARHAVRLFDPRQLDDLALSVAAGPNCILHTAQLQSTQGITTNQAAGQNDNTATTGPMIVAIKQYHRPADLIFEVHQLLITPPSQYTNPLLGVVQLGNQGLTCLVVPYHPLGNLRRYIAEQRANLNALQQMQIIHDIASGLEFLHQRGMQHMNLHSANVLISLQGMAILTDFGRANNRAEVGMPPKPTAELERIRSLTVVFLAPEVLASNSYSSRSEVYALGMVMFELLTGKVAFEKDLSQPGLSTRIMFGRQEEIPTNIKDSPGPAYEALIKDCWKLNPGDRPHLSELKNRLERLMTESRQKTEALKLQQQAVQLQQQQLYQQQRQEQYAQPYQPGAIAPPTPPLPDMPAVDPMHAHAISMRHAASTAAQAAATAASTNIITTQIIVSDKVRPRVESSTKPTAQMQQDATEKQKPVEAWTIGLATSSSITQQRDAIPIPTRALEMASENLRSKSISQSENITSLPLNPDILPTPTATSTVLTATTANGGMSSNATGPSWPMPPKLNNTQQQPEGLTIAITQASTKTVGPEANIPAQNTTSSPASAIPFPPLPPAHPDTDPDFITRAYVTSTSTPSPAVASISSATSASAPSETKPSPILSAGPATLAIPVTQADSTNSKSPTSPSSPTANISPDLLFRPGRNTIIATAALEQQKQQESMPTFFNWRKLPRIPKSDGETTRKISSAASSVQVVEDGYTSSDTDHSVTKGQDNRSEKVKSLIATVESESPALEVSTVPIPELPQSQPPAAAAAAAAATNGKQPRGSVLVIPAFPEPPMTLHNRRISNMDARFRQTGRQATKSQLETHERASSFSSDDSELRGATSPTRTTPGAVMAPQEVGSGTSAATGLMARSTYTPITSADHVPTGTPSNCIYSAAKNGDLVELQEFLNKALTRSLSTNSTSSTSMSGSSSQKRALTSVAAILDEFEPIERLPVLCCAAVARKNKYQALNMVLKAGANVESKEQRGGNTPLHLICETAPPPVIDPTMLRSMRDQLRSLSAVDATGAQMSQLSLLDGDGGDADGDDDDTEGGQEAALKKIDEQDDQEQEAWERVKVDSESIFSIQAINDGYQSLITRQQSFSLGGPYYQMKNHILMKGGLEDQIRLLVLAGSPIDTPNFRGETPLLLLLRFHDSVTALATLLKLGADPTWMAPFGPGTNPPEIHVDPMSMLTPKEQKRMSKSMRATSQKIFSKSISTQQQVSASSDPNHILVMHGSVLAHAAYYLRIDCLKYLLEHEIECSDPAIIEQAIIACQESVSAQVNPSLVVVQQEIARILEKDWKGESGRRRRARVAERILNKKRKPVRSNVLLVALSVSSSMSSTVSLTTSEGDLNSLTPISSSAPASANGSGLARPGYHGKISSVSLGSIPTTHFYASEGPMGTEIELISQHGFVVDPSVPRFQLTDQPMPPSTLSNGADTGGVNRKEDGPLTIEIQGWRSLGSPKSPRLDQSKGIFKKIRNIAKRADELVALAEGEFGFFEEGKEEEAEYMMVPKSTRVEPAAISKPKPFSKYRTEMSKEVNFRRLRMKLRVRAEESDVSRCTPEIHMNL